MMSTTGITFESASRKYIELRDEVELIEAESKKRTAVIKKVMADLEAWITIKAQEQGLDSVKTPYGTAYWSEHCSATCGNPSVFKQYVIDNQYWDLIETRAAKIAIKSHIAAHGEPPPGINFSTVRVFNLRSKE